ncbi:transposase [Arsenophonus endosymbiont of Aphis craccivora]|uniref:transposase n=1 Tax=Arsenophonus endosymbiont of Aphis craccivora TaxID=1231049 RepID=UPI001EE1F097|nr:transposase [Arsenophonus endosymbiont of Aphis craccivora]
MESAIAGWTDSSSPEGRGRPLYYSDMAVTTVLMMKRVFNLSLGHYRASLIRF